MTDDTDVYLGRCLKNWAEREKSHARSKDSLLRLAAAQSKMDRLRETTNQDQFEEFYNYRYRPSVAYTGIYLRGSFTLSLGWTVDLSTLLRIAQ